MKDFPAQLQQNTSGDVVQIDDDVLYNYDILGKFFVQVMVMMKANKSNMNTLMNLKWRNIFHCADNQKHMIH